MTGHTIGNKSSAVTPVTINMIGSGALPPIAPLAANLTKAFGHRVHLTVLVTAQRSLSS